MVWNYYGSIRKMTPWKRLYSMKSYMEGAWKGRYND